MARYLWAKQQRALLRRQQICCCLESVAAWGSKAVIHTPIQEQALIQTQFDRSRPRVQDRCEHRLQRWPAAHDETQPPIAVRDQSSAFFACNSLELLQEELVVPTRAMDRNRVARVECDASTRVK